MNTQPSVAVAGLLAAGVPRRWLGAYLTALSGLMLAGLLLSRTFTDLGHAVAWLIGLGLALLATRARRASTGRLAPPGVPCEATGDG